MEIVDEFDRLDAELALDKTRTPYEKIARTLLALKLKETPDGDPNKEHLQALENEMLIHERQLIKKAAKPRRRAAKRPSYKRSSADSKRIQ